MSERNFRQPLSILSAVAVEPIGLFAPGTLGIGCGSLSLATRECRPLVPLCFSLESIAHQDSFDSRLAQSNCSTWRSSLGLSGNLGPDYLRCRAFAAFTAVNKRLCQESQSYPPLRRRKNC